MWPTLVFVLLLSTTSHHVSAMAELPSEKQAPLFDGKVAHDAGFDDKKVFSPSDSGEEGTVDVSGISEKSLLRKLDLKLLPPLSLLYLLSFLDRSNGMFLFPISLVSQHLRMRMEIKDQSQIAKKNHSCQCSCRRTRHRFEHDREPISYWTHALLHRLCDI
jgi:hypothetical protein